MADGTPKLIDFGIAKLTEASAYRRTVATTRTGMLPLTLDYASPEQTRGQAVSTASDVYSLGVVLYELLVGRRPYSVAGLSPAAAERVVCEEVPVAPSAAVAADLRRSGTPARHTTQHGSPAQELQPLSDDVRQENSTGRSAHVLCVGEIIGGREAVPDQDWAKV